MKIFITGATGFIGSNVIKKLETEGFELLLLTRDPRKLEYDKSSGKIITIYGDLSNIDAWKEELKKNPVDAAIHLAWESIPDYNSKVSTTNLIYGLNLFSCLAEAGCKRIICMGSCWEYGQHSEILGENAELKEFNAFSAAKKALSIMGREIAKENNMQFIWLRLFFVYGPGQKNTSLIPYIINCIRHGNRPEIKTPSAKNDFIYINDVVNAIVDILKYCNSSTVYNVGSGILTSVGDVVNIVYECLNVNNDLKTSLVRESKVASYFYWADISKIKKEIGWMPQINMKQGIQKSIDYYLKDEVY